MTNAALERLPGPTDRGRSSVGSWRSPGSAGSLLSLGSVGSVLSIGSSGSLLSIGSAGSILSLGSWCSIGAVRGAYRTRRDRAVRRPATAPPAGPDAGAAVGLPA
ncbi:hypothetical protein JL107_18765 [Nakamurella flavida]|uniref:Uncharacterized protein n=1 Tax=Nakamurella flavida TaxID=363630 RepID=A0A939C293_9ACTN|nr:hypothetical protein [Nakamurella flavida]MBM9478498.1 hypothetical protein [Nakamurella flavida]MDP9777676.1 hypothetical protein [Nakamurella flavida]